MKQRSLHGDITVTEAQTIVMNAERGVIDASDPTIAPVVAASRRVLVRAQLWGGVVTSRQYRNRLWVGLLAGFVAIGCATGAAMPW